MGLKYAPAVSSDVASGATSVWSSAEPPCLGLLGLSDVVMPLDPSRSVVKRRHVRLSRRELDTRLDGLIVRRILTLFISKDGYADLT